MTAALALCGVRRQADDAPSIVAYVMPDGVERNFLRVRHTAGNLRAP
jgi:hypothetical protein